MKWNPSQADIEIIILGSGSSTPVPGRHHSAQFVRWKHHRWLLDCGEGTQFRMAEEKTGAPHRIFITHRHGDHILGLPGLLFTLAGNRLSRPLHIHAPASFIHFWNDCMLSWWEGFTVDIPIILHTVPTDRPGMILSFPDVEIFAIPLHHSVPTAGFILRERIPPWKLLPERIERLNIPSHLLKPLQWGNSVIWNGRTIHPEEVGIRRSTRPRSYAYLTDTTPRREIEPFLTKVQVLYHEATFSGKDADLARTHMHSDIVSVAQYARDVQAQVLLFGHVSARYPDIEELVREARQIFPHTYPALEGMRIQLFPGKTRILYPGTANPPAEVTEIPG